MLGMQNIQDMLDMQNIQDMLDMQNIQDMLNMQNMQGTQDMHDMQDLQGLFAEVYIYLGLFYARIECLKWSTHIVYVWKKCLKMKFNSRALSQYQVDVPK